MQLLIPTARAVARKYGSGAVINSAEDLYQPAVNIELGTAYMRDQLDKFGRIEYVAVAYNAGPGRVDPWHASLPMEIDEFVEEIPFKETKAYVQGVIRNRLNIAACTTRTATSNRTSAPPAEGRDRFETA